MLSLSTLLASSVVILGLNVSIVEPASTPETWWSWEGALYLLSGIELTRFEGSAEVWSQLRQEDGSRSTIASGNASHGGWGLSLYSGPLATGWRLAPTAGLMSHRVAISDLAASLPSTTEPGAQDIPGMCSDPETGEGVSCGVPNDYDLALRSIHVGGLAGYDLVMDIEGFHLFVGAYGQFNLAEYRRTEVTIADMVREHAQFSFFRSIGLEGTTGISWPAWHVALRATLGWKLHYDFRFGEPITFQNTPVYDEERNVYVRPRVDIDRASLQTFNAALSLAYIF